MTHKETGYFRFAKIIIKRSQGICDRISVTDCRLGFLEVFHECVGEGGMESSPLRWWCWAGVGVLNLIFCCLWDLVKCKWKCEKQRSRIRLRKGNEEEDEEFVRSIRFIEM